MAFAIAGLARASASGNTAAPALWTYTTADTIATVLGANYFDAAATAGTIKAHDVIICISTNGGTPSVDIEFVLSISAADVVVLGATDINDA